MYVQKKELWIPCPGGDLYGVLFLPGKGGKLPAVILSHGLYSSCEATALSAQVLAEAGYAAICFDYHGCSYTNKSGGDMFHCSPLTEKDELSAVLDYARSLDCVDTKKIYLLGQSMGSIVATLVGSARQADIAGMILMYFPAHAIEVIRQMFPSEESIPDAVESFLGIPSLTVGKQFFVDALQIDIPKAASQYPGPVYLITGDQDELIPVETAKNSCSLFQQATLEIVEGGEHGFQLSSEQALRIMNALEQ